MKIEIRKVILWLPATIMAIAAVVVLLILTTNNNQRIHKLEDSNNQSTITFTFNQGAARFRILCKEDPNNPTVYICTTIRIGPSPRPSSTPGG
jgi:hypothetical protein